MIITIDIPHDAVADLLEVAKGLNVTIEQAAVRCLLAGIDEQGFWDDDDD